jgi:hypothetical protein
MSSTNTAAAAKVFIDFPRVSYRIIARSTHYQPIVASVYYYLSRILLIGRSNRDVRKSVGQLSIRSDETGFSTASAAVTIGHSAGEHSARALLPKDNNQIPN